MDFAVVDLPTIQTKSCPFFFFFVCFNRVELLVRSIFKIKGHFILC